MLYTKIRIEDKWYPKRLYRVVALKANPRLSILGAVFGKIFEASFDHCFMFRTKHECFVPSSWMNQYEPIMEENSISFTYLNDLKEEFEYEYDTGEGYEFKCKKYKKKVEIIKEGLNEEDYPDVIVLEAKGAGIFEDNHGMLNDYLAGRISGDFSYEDEDEEYFYMMPYNLELAKLSDFDNEIDLDKYELFYDEVEYISKDFDEEIIDEPMDYHEDDEGFYEWLLKKEVANDIFNYDAVNRVFRELIKSIDINDAYELLCQTYKEVEEFDDEDEYSDEEYHKLFIEKINALIKH